MTDRDVEALLKEWGTWARETAPPVAVAPARPDRRSRTVIIYLAAAVLVAVLVGAGVIALNATRGRSTNGSVSEQSTAPVPALSCPASIPRETSPRDPWVPARPQGITTADRLVPAQTPATAVICKYTRLVQQAPATRLLGKLDAVAADLHQWGTSEPNAGIGACPDYLARTDNDYYLIGLSYQGGSVWVAAPGNHCTGSGNGDIVAPVNLRADAATAYTTGRWDTDPVATAICTRPSTQAVPDAAAIPPEPTNLTVCATASGTTRAYTYDLTHLNGLQLGATLKPFLDQIAGKDCVRLTTDNSIALVLRYTNAPDVVLVVSHTCANNAPGATSTSTDLALEIREFIIYRL